MLLLITNCVGIALSFLNFELNKINGCDFPEQVIPWASPFSKFELFYKLFQIMIPFFLSF